MKTHKEMVNNVLVRLREREVDSVNENSYSKLISLFINDAKEFVESAWNWSVLRQTLTAVTQDGVFNYVLTNSGNNVAILDVVNLTSNTFLKYKDPHWFNNVFLNNTPVEGNPEYYVFNGVSVAGDTQVDLYPIPNGEDGGMSAVSAKALAQNFLSDAIALDANKHPEELIWEVY